MSLDANLRARLKVMLADILAGRPLPRSPELDALAERVARERAVRPALTEEEIARLVDRIARDVAGIDD